MSRRTVCFGELLLRLSAPGRELLLQSPKFDVHVGGAEANVAVGLARLGHATAMVSRVPANALGEAATGYLRRHGVDTAGIATGPGRMGLYFLAVGASLRASDIVYDREGSSFALAGAAAYDWPRLLDGAARLHLSGITPALGSGPAEVALAAAEAAEAAGVAVSFDGNFRAHLWQRWESDPRTILSRLVAKADLLFGSHRDIALLLDREYDGSTLEGRRRAAEAAFEAFPRLQMIASTARSTENVDNHRIRARLDTRERGIESEEVLVPGIVDRIGGGDAFAAGVLHGLGDGDPETALRSGLALAVLKHSLPGDASLFSREDIEAFNAGDLDVRR